LTLQADLVIASHPYLYPAIRSVYRGRIYYEAHNVEFDMKRDILRDLPGAEPWLELARATESACCLDAVGVCACSEQDRDRLHDLYAVPLGAIEVVPNGVAAGEIPCVSTHQRRRSARRLLGDYRAAAVFIGSWHGPNNEAMAWIIEHLAPRLPGICFWIIGSVCNYWEKGGNKSAVANVVLLGQLDEADKNAALSCAQVALNPVISGSGSNLKMAEYVASGLAVLSTPFGCRGFELDGLHSVRVAELEGFAEELERLVDQPAEGSPREDKWTDREVVIENHDWNDIADGYFAHLVSVYANSVYNRRPGTTGVFLE
jgi:hypothetical protein